MKHKYSNVLITFEDVLVGFRMLHFW